MSTRVAIVNGYVLSMDPGIGELERGTVLVEDDRIAAVGRTSGSWTPARSTLAAAW